MTTPNPTTPTVVSQGRVPEHPMRFAGTTVGSGFRYSVIRVIGGNPKANPRIAVTPTVMRTERSLRHG